MKAPPALAPQFDDLAQEGEAASFGMWLFLGAEIIFFGAIILSFAYYRFAYPEDFGRASNHTKIVLGTLNTGVLLTSSLFVALSVHAARKDKTGALVTYLLLTVALGTLFLAIKFTEYHEEIDEHLLPGPDFRFTGADAGHAQLFFTFYWIMTGIHALHVAIGVVALAAVAWKAFSGEFTPENHHGVELTGLYWHFVDVVWIFLFPLLYLLGRHLSHG